MAVNSMPTLHSNTFTSVKELNPFWVISIGGDKVQRDEQDQDNLVN